MGPSGEDSVVQQKIDVENATPNSRLLSSYNNGGFNVKLTPNLGAPVAPTNLVDPIGRPTGPDLAEVTVTATQTNSGRNTGIPGTRFSKSELGFVSFPLDVENSDLPHVMFHIFETQTTGATTAQNETEASLYKGIDTVAAGGTVLAGEINTATGGLLGSVEGAAANAVNSVGKVLGINDIVGQTKNAFKNFSLSRNTEQLSTSIVLFMPEGLNTSYEQKYNDISLTATLGGLGMFAQALGADKEVEAIDPFIIEAASKVAGSLPGVESSQDLTNLLLFGTTGRAINPQLEMLYSSPSLRTFTFDFRLVPRNYSEAQQIYTIVQMFKYYSAPDIPKGSSGRYFIPPARFEIEFHHKGELNTNLFKTKQCVLENVTIDYAPNGYATHYDGQPVETRLSLIFRETTIIDKNAVEEGY